MLLFKSLALCQLSVIYLFPVAFKGYNPVLGGNIDISFVFDPISIILIIIGYGISVLATHALGVDRTYFASELGLLPPKWVDQFPYGYVLNGLNILSYFCMVHLFSIP